MLDELLHRFAQHDRQALSRLLTLAARGVEIPVRRPAGESPTRVVAVTGSGGVGKSTLVGKLIECFRRRNLSVAVLACDPESPLSGGALLGDRFRMPSRPDDDGVFIRSLAAASGHGAIADHLPPLIRLLESFGFDLIILETAGAGQGDTQSRQLSDVLVLLVQPETGDDVQWEKAGLTEVADIVVVHKADLPGADQAAAQLRNALDLNGPRPVPVLQVSSQTGAGLDELVQTVLDLTPRRSEGAPGRELLALAQQTLAARFASAEIGADDRLRRLIADWQHGRLDSAAAASTLLHLLASDSEPRA